MSGSHRDPAGLALARGRRSRSFCSRRHAGAVRRRAAPASVGYGGLSFVVALRSPSPAVGALDRVAQPGNADRLDLPRRALTLGPRRPGHQLRRLLASTARLRCRALGKTAAWLRSLGLDPLRPRAARLPAAAVPRRPPASRRAGGRSRGCAGLGIAGGFVALAACARARSRTAPQRVEPVRRPGPVLDPLDAGCRSWCS